MSGPSDKRTFTRIAVVVEVDVTSGSNFFTGKTRDLSLGGVFVETELQLEIGSALTLELALKGRRFRIASEVMWTLVGQDRRVVGAGVRFTAIEPSAKRAIEDFMRTRAPMQFEEDGGVEEVDD